MRAPEYRVYIRLREYDGGPTGPCRRQWQGLTQPRSRGIGRYRIRLGDARHEEALCPDDCCDTRRGWPRLPVASMLPLAKWSGFNASVTHLRRDGCPFAGVQPTGSGSHDSRRAVGWVRSWLQFLWRKLAPSVVRPAGVCPRPQHRSRYRAVRPFRRVSSWHGGAIPRNRVREGRRGFPPSVT